MDPEGMRFCTTCGSQRTGTHSFCTACGAEFRDLEQPEPPATAAGPVAGPAVPDPDQDHPDVTFMELGGSPETMATQAELHVAEPPYARSAPIGPTLIEPSAGGPGHADGGSYPGSAPYPRPISRPPGWRNKIIIMGAVAVIMLGAAGGAYAVVADHGHGKVSSEQTQTASDAASHTAPASAVPTSAVPTSAVPTTSAPVSPTAGSGSTVAVAPGVAGNPAAPQVTMLLNHYFTAINRHDYSAWVSLFDQQLQQADSKSSFDAGYATTADSAVTLTSISGTGSGSLAASVTFTSQQSPADSPDNSSCDQWSIMLFLVPDGSGYLIGPPPSSYHASYQAC
jgi:hypothetical protein